jgi:hypothetical protein
MPTHPTRPTISASNLPRRKVTKPRKIYTRGGTLRLLEGTTLETFLRELHPEEARQAEEMWKKHTEAKVDNEQNHA